MTAYHRQLAVLHVVFLLSVSTGLAADNGRMRTWTSASGAAMEAAFVRIEGSLAFFERPDGSEINIALSALSEPDRTLVLKLAAAAGHVTDSGTGAVKRASQDRLPVFADGTWKGMNLVYRAMKYRAWIDDRGFLHIQPLVNGQDQGPELWHRITAFYIDDSKTPPQKPVLREVADFPQPPAPVIVDGDMHEVTLQMCLVDDVKVEEVLHFAPDKITLRASRQDPRGQKYPTVWGFGFWFKRSVQPDSERTLEQLKAMLKDWQLTLKSKDGGREIYPFWKSMTKIPGIVEASVKGPWGERELCFDMPPGGRRKAQVFSVFDVYSRMSPADGFTLGRRMEADSDAEVNYIVTFK